MTTPFCQYCKNPAVLVGGKVIYPHRKDLYEKQFYHCAPCGAYVGCHPGGDKPLGLLANAELRAAKQRAHAAFDPLWLRGTMKRKQAYKWLADCMGIRFEDCHIGEFDINQCSDVVRIVRARNG